MSSLRFEPRLFALLSIALVAVASIAASGGDTAPSQPIAAISTSTSEPNAATEVTGKPIRPRVFILDPASLVILKQRYKAGDKTIAAAVAQLEKDAKAELSSGPYSVINKDFTPPSGDKHDYLSQAPYFWPDPNVPDGLPYIRHDGERNPETRKYHNRVDLGRLYEGVDALALAYYFTDDENYAAKATQLLRAWFLDPATKMNPNLEFAQFIPGANTGRGTGLIETSGLTRLTDAVGLLQGSKAWTDADQTGMQDWFTKFVAWMQDSKNGKAEAAARNNHGSYYDMQLTCYALFTDNTELAKKTLQNVGKKRIAVQIEPNGASRWNWRAPTLGVTRS